MLLSTVHSFTTYHHVNTLCWIPQDLLSGFTVCWESQTGEPLHIFVITLPGVILYACLLSFFSTRMWAPRGQGLCFLTIQAEPMAGEALSEYLWPLKGEMWYFRDVKRRKREAKGEMPFSAEDGMEGGLVRKVPKRRLPKDQSQGLPWWSSG